MPEIRRQTSEAFAEEETEQGSEARPAKKQDEQSGLCDGDTQVRAQTSADHKEEVTAMSKGYEGKIKNSGTQHVKAPNGGKASVKGNVRITGNDLRTGKKSGK